MTFGQYKKEAVFSNSLGIGSLLLARTLRKIACLMVKWERDLGKKRPINLLANQIFITNTDRYTST